MATRGRRPFPKVLLDNRRNQPVTVTSSWNPITNVIIVQILDNRADNQVKNDVIAPQKTVTLDLAYAPKKICERCTQPLKEHSIRILADGSKAQRYCCKNMHYVEVPKK